jgi:hypothetical protein
MQSVPQIGTDFAAHVRVSRRHEIVMYHTHKLLSWDRIWLLCSRSAFMGTLKVGPDLYNTSH